MKVYKSIDQLVGNTPIVELVALKKKLNLKANIYAKLEFFNPAGSVKDRVALKMINEAEKKGLLKEGSVIIEPTSGNTGIGLASIAASRGYRTIIVMPDTMSIERRLLMTSYGAELVLTEGFRGMAGAIEKAKELAKITDGSFVPGQFVNPDNPAAHYESTGPEIWSDTEGNIDVFVAGVGTGGTITGVSKYLKEKNNDIHIVAVEPKNSPVLSGGDSGAHGIQGIGAGFVPEILDVSILDEVVTVSEDDAYFAGRLLGKTEGIVVGISSGAALFSAIEIAKLDKYYGKNIVVLLPDSGDRYLSTPMFKED